MGTRRRSGTAALGVVLVAVLTPALAGCSTPSAEPTASPTASASASAAPLFASEEEALAAATEAYERYQAALDEAFSSYEIGGLDTVATGEALDEAVTAVSGFESRGHIQVGQAAVSSTSVVDLSSLLEDANAEPVQIYACLDVGEVDVVDEGGASVSDPAGLDVFPMLVSLTSIESGSRLLVSEEREWAGEDFC